jgi:signal transduction histidine kinase
VLTRSDTTLIVGLSFGAVLALGGVVTFVTSQTITGLQQSIVELMESSRTLDHSIQSLRSHIYVSAIVVRDSLLDSSSDQRTSYTTQLNEHHRAATANMDSVLQLSSASHARTVESLVRETRAYWQSIAEVSALSGPERAAIGYRYVRTKIIPRREAVMIVAEELADLQAAETSEAQRNLAGTISSFRERIERIRGLAVAIVALVALLCTWRVYSLQRVADAERIRRNEAESELRQLAQKLVRAHEDERRLLSRELHDHVGQMMTALRFRLGALEAENSSPTKAFRKMVEESRSLLEGTIEAIRHMAMGLRPAMLDDLGMSAAIEWHTREFSKRFDIPVSLKLGEGANDLPEPHRTCVYRIVQEALTNCARHAQASSVHIDLQCENNWVELTVMDNGVGLTKATKSNGGFGLAGIEERVRELNGTFSARSPQNGGTVLDVKIPVPGAIVHAKS